MKRTLIAAALALVSTIAFAAPTSYKIDPNHTDVVASWSHFGFSNPIANFLKADGVIVYDPANVAASKVEVTLPLDGLDALFAQMTRAAVSALGLKLFAARPNSGLTVITVPEGLDGSAVLKAMEKKHGYKQTGILSNDQAEDFFKNNKNVKVHRK